MLQFASPLILWALAVLPVIWVLLRAVPPSPVKRTFAAVTLLLGLKDKDQVSDRTPWWLLLMRTVALGACIIGLAKPALHSGDSGFVRDRMLIVLDGGFAHEKFAQSHRSQMDTLLNSAQSDQKLIAVLNIANPGALDWQNADFHRERLANWTPSAWLPDFMSSLNYLASNTLEYDTVWFSDGLGYDRQRIALLELFTKRGSVEIRVPDDGIGVLRSVIRDGDELIATADFSDGIEGVHEVVFRGLTPSGHSAEFARVPLSLETLRATTSLPAELSARLTNVFIENETHAGAIVHVSDYLARPRVGLFSPDRSEEVAELLQPLHYLRTALRQNAEIIEQSLDDILLSKPDAIFMADVSRPPNEIQLVDWVTDGGTLVRFAGPNTALNAVELTESELMPVRLRQGGRQLGGAMTWETPKQLAPFSRESPFFGLDIPNDIRVNAQVLAEPDADLSSRVIAELADGTPLVTRLAVGDGQVVFFHVTANADWSNLALSELFIEMIKRVVSRALILEDNEIPETLTWQTIQLINNTGKLVAPEIPVTVTSEQLASGTVSAEIPGGIYQSDAFTVALNIGANAGDISPMKWPSDVNVQIGDAGTNVISLAHYMFVLALLLLMLDVIASARVAGRLVLVISCLCVSSPEGLRAETELSAASEITFAHVVTGDPRLDQMARSGLFGLSDALFFRTSVEPSLPVGVDVEFDELAFYPFIYWPIPETEVLLTPNAIARVNRYMRQGGVVVFDSRDAGIGNKQTYLRNLLRQLDIPPLDPLPKDHVINRTFYLTQDAPGRYTDGQVWVQAAVNNAPSDPALPFRKLNDGVTPVIIGSNDWAAAWAINQQGDPMYPIGRGRAGERQREMAIRFGINLVMYVLTGNYKSDQVHVPALLDRLGQ